MGRQRRFWLVVVVVIVVVVVVAAVAVVVVVVVLVNLTEMIKLRMESMRFEINRTSEVFDLSFGAR